MKIRTITWKGKKIPPAVESKIPSIKYIYSLVKTSNIVNNYVDFSNIFRDQKKLRAKLEIFEIVTITWMAKKTG